ncbi:MAG TPA: 30S ribosomal protein S16 [Acidimicrobiia bacterium]|nr:30S ribosomal protein S16 [Acidimicrobiia bacterium]
MAVRLRLMRMGKKKQPVYRVVVMDQRAPRDGRYIEQIGRYDAREDPSIVEIDNERAVDWLSKGAQPSETVEKLLNISGAMNTMKIQAGGIHVVGVDKQTAPTAVAPVVDEPAEPGEVADSDESPTGDAGTEEE